jgi:hypothetical protein
VGRGRGNGEATGFVEEDMVGGRDVEVDPLAGEKLYMLGLLGAYGV